MAKTTVIWMDWCDKRSPWEFAQELFERLEKSGAFIQSRSWEEEGCVVLSKTPLSEKQTDDAIARSRAPFDLDTAQEWIVDVASAVDTYKDLGISAKKVNRIAKAKGFKMPNGWYISGHKNCLLCSNGPEEKPIAQTVGEAASVQA